jgi:hypothetical protein
MTGVVNPYLTKIADIGISDVNGGRQAVSPETVLAAPLWLCGKK